jgi:hypothetical protein
MRFIGFLFLLSVLSCAGAGLALADEMAPQAAAPASLSSAISSTRALPQLASWPRMTLDGQAPRLERWTSPGLMGEFGTATAPGRLQAAPSAGSCCPDPCCRTYANWENECCWEFEISLDAWIPGIDGDVGIGPHDTNVNVSVGDLLNNLGKILEDLDFFLQGGVGVQYGRWRLGLALNGAELGQTFKLRQGGRDVDADIKLVNWQANVYYRAGMSRIGCGPCPQLIVYEPYVGIRGMKVDVDASKDPGIALSVGDHWVDPVVGAKVTWDLRNRWAVEFEGDIGGFGVSSDLTWKLRLGVGWRFARQWSLRAGWLALHTDFESGTGNDRFKWDATQSGPYLGIGFSF